MKDELAASAVADGDDPEIRAILEDVCRITGMGFAAVARVTEERWIACQVCDKIAFGLNPGDELAIATTICDDIRKTRQSIVIDHVALDKDWRTHPTPILYGFQSYASLPLILDGSFYGTLCAIDPAPNLLRSEGIIAQLEAYARRVEAILAARR